MSGRHLVDEMRSTMPPVSDPARRGRAIDIILAAVAVMAIGALGVVGYNTLFAGRSPQRPVQMASAAPAADVEWTDADSTQCESRARSASSDPDTGSYLITNRSLAEGVPYLTTKVTCYLSTKPERFCSAEGKSKLIALINDYIDRMDLLKLGIAAQGAPMAIAGGLFGGEAAAGDGVYSAMAEDTLAYMRDHDEGVVAAIRKLGEGGVIAADAFRPLPFAGIPKRVEQIFAGVTPTGNSCA